MHAEVAAEGPDPVDKARDPDPLALLTLGEKLFRIRDGLEQFGDFLSASLADRIRAKAHGGAPGIAPAAQLASRDPLSLAPEQYSGDPQCRENGAEKVHNRDYRT